MYASKSELPRRFCCSTDGECGAVLGVHFTGGGELSRGVLRSVAAIGVLHQQPLYGTQARKFSPLSDGVVRFHHSRAMTSTTTRLSVACARCRYSRGAPLVASYGTCESNL
ncbi:unnamed protein product [Ectocarpus sp. 6 AP-2014]